MIYKKLATNLIQLTQDACLKAFWRKKALWTFLKQHHITDNMLATWHADESKRDFLYRLFGEHLLQTADNKGHQVILAMARSLADMTHFPDLEGWEDSREKLDAAREAVARLKKEVGKLNAQVRDAKAVEKVKQTAREQREKAIASQQTLTTLADQLNELAKALGTQQGGYDFEKWFYALANYFELPARPPYWADKRQIDGSLTLDGTTFLIETKFTKEQIGAPDIDTFMTKTRRKADNTMGIVLSMSGFSSTAIDEASCDGTPILLMDSAHIYGLILTGMMSFPDIIRRIKRHASQTGKAYLDVKDFSG